MTHSFPTRRSSGPLGHSAAYYWKGKVPAAQFFCALPFGPTAQEMNAWLYRGGGIALWEQAYKPFGILPMACGATGHRQDAERSEEHTSELQSLMRNSYATFSLKKKNT